MNTLLDVLLIGLHFTITVIAASHALLNKHDGRAAFGWVATCRY